VDSELETDIVLMYGTAVPAATSSLSSPHQHEPLQFRLPSRRLAGGPAPPSSRLVPPVRLWGVRVDEVGVEDAVPARQLPSRAAANFLDLDPVPERKQERN
jgi:hypothetical protein